MSGEERLLCTICVQPWGSDSGAISMSMPTVMPTFFPGRQHTCRAERSSGTAAITDVDTVVGDKRRGWFSAATEEDVENAP